MLLAGSGSGSKCFSSDRFVHHVHTVVLLTEPVLLLLLITPPRCLYSGLKLREMHHNEFFT